MRTMVRGLVVASAVAALASGARPTGALGADDAAAVAEFENEVRPLLAAKCYRCHGPKKQESGLRLDGRAAILRGGDTGPAVVPGEPERSPLLRAVRHEGDFEMPPDERLEDGQVAALERWIARGALWPGDEGSPAPRPGGIGPEDRAFWSFRPVDPPPPPEVADRSWPKSPVDPWILAALEAKGLRPGPRAGRRTWLRRVSFDLTGLPPTPEEVEDFAADDSPGAKARVVDRLLASEAYGERWGRHWLDVARYADTAGETADYPVREAYRYRDWVIDAFNADMPYDRFVREQVAGDILAREGPREGFAASVTATGFLALSRRFGFDSENYQHLTIQDTIDTLGQAFLGLTIGCARCHDHKYDPISAADYYALYGIFEGTRYAFPGSEQKPFVRAMASLVSPSEAAPLARAFDRELASIESKLGAHQAARPRVVLRTLDDMDGDFELQAKSDGGSLGCLVPPWVADGRPEVTERAQSPFAHLAPRPGKSGVSFPADAEAHRLRQAVRLAPPEGIGSPLHLSLDFRIGEAPSPAKGGYRLTLGDGPEVEVRIDADSLKIRDGEAFAEVASLASGTWYSLQLAIDPDGRTISGSVGVPGKRTGFSARGRGAGRSEAPVMVSLEAFGEAGGIRPALDVDNLFVGNASIPPPALRPADGAPAPAEKADSEAAGRRHAALVAGGPCAWAYAVAEGTPVDARIQRRGEPGRPGEVVPRRFLEILGGDRVPPDSKGSGRRELADWLTRPSNPLTARVMVNRIWAHHFGRGIVPTPNDFGRRGQPPSHPGLLDDLARRFTDGGWSVKAMHRLIVLSSTYGLASRGEEAPPEEDPDGVLLATFPRRRLDAESIRDAMLALGGLLDRSPAGPHSFPRVGKAFTQHNPFDAVYDTDRRGVYLMQPRLRRHPYLALFDGADPNASTAARVVTTAPTQALFFMNSPFVHRCSDGFARRLMEAREGDEARIRLACRMALAREPDADDLASALAFVAEYRRQLETSGAASEGREATCWAAYARTLLCSNEFLFID